MKQVTKKKQKQPSQEPKETKTQPISKKKQKSESEKKENPSKVDDKKKEKKGENKETKKEKVIIKVDEKIDKNNVLNCFNALLEVIEKSNNTKKQLFDDGEPVQLMITLHRIYHKTRAKPFMIPIPHSLCSEATDICVFVKDPANEYKQLFKDKNVPNVKKVMGVETLRNKYSRYEARRKLLQSYDLFLCDDSLSLVLRRFLGKNFFKSKRYPIPIRMTGNLCENVVKARDSTYLYISQGSTLNVRIGYTSMDANAVCENVMTSLQKIVAKIPGQWENIKTLSLKTKNSISIPFYTNYPSPSPQIPHTDAPQEEKVDEE
jgi:ribosome biogenesis protein UTP30